MNGRAWEVWIPFVRFIDSSWGFVSAMAAEVKGVFAISEKYSLIRRMLCRIFEKGLDGQLADRNLAAHAGSDVVPVESWAGMEVADPMKLAATAFVLEGMRARIEGAEHNIVFRRLVRGMREIDVPECARAWPTYEENLQRLGRAKGRRRPIGFAMLADVLGDRDGRESEDRGFASGRRRPGDVDVHPEICAVVDARDQPELRSFVPSNSFPKNLARKRRPLAKRDPGTIRRRSIETESTRREFLEGHRTLGGHRMPDPALGARRRNDQAIGPGGEEFMERCEPIRLDAIVVRENDSALRCVGWVIGECGIL
jgi:hypothetical protein